MMCGFIGISSTARTYRTEFDKGLRAVSARGRTSDVLHVDGASYGYCRLPTDDVANEELASILQQDDSVLLFNGLITNTRQLADRYELSSTSITSDTLCLREGLQRHGLPFLRHCRGMFALARIDATAAMLARDTVGIKPLYYVHDSDIFAFASEMKALTPLHKTIYEVLPGEIITYHRETGALSRQYFVYDEEPANFEQSLTEAIVAPTRRYLQQSGKNVALLMSGGLDSSIIAQVLVNHLPKAQHKRLSAFCIGNINAADVRAASKLAQHLGLRLTHVPLPAGQVLVSRLPRVVYDVESPFARVSRIALLYDELAEAIKQRGIDIVIGGEGADELFYGYDRLLHGLKPEQAAKAYTMFFEEVFYNTLLQRYERIFARRLIEGRVPYLDQQVVAAAYALAPEHKVHYVSHSEQITKVPLRKFAQQIGLPDYIYNRPKEKMASGATGRTNDDSLHSYLEVEVQQMTGYSFQELVTALYRIHYHQMSGDSLRRSKKFKLEEDVMKLVYDFRQEVESRI